MQADKANSFEIIKKRADFVRINTVCKKWVSHGLILQVAPNDLGQCRVGYTVSKKVDKSAVKRNRIKRRLREVAAEILPLYARESADYVLIGRALSATRPYETMKKDLIWCLEKTGYNR